MKHEISVLEDCFEAFVGVTELLIEQMVEGGGFYYCNVFGFISICLFNL